MAAKVEVERANESVQAVSLKSGEFLVSKGDVYLKLGNDMAKLTDGSCWHPCAISNGRKLLPGERIILTVE